MKSVMMILCMLGGLAISNADAQTTKAACTPSPSCCAKATPTGAKSTAAVVEPGTAVFASCSPEAMAACEGKKMSKKEMKECQEKCATNPACATAPACQGKGTAEALPATPKAAPVVKPAKG